MIIKIITTENRARLLKSLVYSDSDMICLILCRISRGEVYSERFQALETSESQSRSRGVGAAISCLTLPFSTVIRYFADARICCYGIPN